MAKTSRHMKSIILYCIFGAITTAVNILTYTVCYQYFLIRNVYSNVIAWILAVMFAFISNKLWVFESKSCESSAFLSELSSFFLCRVATGLLDLLIMYICVDQLSLNAFIMKILANTIVIVLNYVASKMLIFKSELVKEH